MANRYDVAARLAEGSAAVERIQAYVQACQALGYQQPDLTAHASQVGDWYDTEAGLDLRVLDSDVTELRAAITAIDEALWVQRTQVSDLAAAWRGSGAGSAAHFLQRHCDAAEEVAAHVRSAAAQCASLLEALWRAVDGKVATTVAIDERSAAQRSSWLAAGQAVLAGDRSSAEVIVHRQVMPFVDNDIRNDWLAAMCAANASVAASYDTAIHALASTREVRFDIPGDLGPLRQPADDPAVPPVMPPPTGPPPTVPAAATPSPEAPQQLPPDEIEATPTDPTTPLVDAASLPTGAGGLGGLGGITGGIGGAIGSIVDSIGGLLGSLAGGLGGSDANDPIGLEDVDDPALDDADSPDAAEDGPEAGPLGKDVTAEAPAVEKSSPATEPVAQPVAQPVDAPPPDVPPPGDQSPPAAAPVADGSTPCEIAEDQLPQAGQ